MKYIILITTCVFILSIGLNAQNHQEIESPTSDVLSLSSTGSSSTVLNFLNANAAPTGGSDKRAYISTNGNILNLGLSNNNTGGRIEFFGQGLRRMTMNADGRFGIGDIIPTQQLDVDGQIRVRDDLNADQFINLSDKGIKFDNGQEVNELLPMFYAIYIGGAGFGPIPGEVRLFAIVQLDRIPAGWIKCDGSLLNISEHTFLFSLLGSEYGGDGRNTFAVPDLRKALPIQKI